MVFDNGRKFDSDKVWDYCAEVCDQMTFTAAARPQMIGQAKSTNKQILNGLKKRLDNTKGLWADELNTMVHSGNREEHNWGNPFLTCLWLRGMLPVEVAINTHWIINLLENLKNKALREALDLLPMVRGDVYLREEITKIRMARLYNHKVKGRTLRERDLVLWKNGGHQKGGNSSEAHT